MRRIEAGRMLGYSVIQLYQPAHRMMSKERGMIGPVFSAAQLAAPPFDQEPLRFLEEDVLDFGEEKDSGTSDEGQSDGMHYCSTSRFSPSEDLFLNQQQTWVQTEHQSLELIGLLTLCAESIVAGDHAATGCTLSRLGETASPRGTPIQRVVAYFTEALALRAARQWPQVFAIAPPREISDQIDDDEDALSLRLLNQVSPIPRFLHFTLNESILRAFEGKERVHIIDFDIKEGLQWPSLLQGLASRPHPPSHVRVTGIGDSRQDLQETGARLKALAESLGLHLEFHPVVDRLEDVRLWMLHVKDGECVAVNCISQLHRVFDDDDRSTLMNLLGLVRSTNPAVVAVAEEEAEHNDPRWERRFGGALRYYAAIFDSLDASLLPQDSTARIKIEEMFARRIRNVVSCDEGAGRVERHEVFDKWRKMMAEGGFRCLDLGEREAIQGRMLLKMYTCGESFGVERRRSEGGDALTLRWLDQPLYTASAWAPASCAEAAGSPSACHPD